jgi:hypothetical protein
VCQFCMAAGIVSFWRRDRPAQLNQQQLEALAVALLNFESVADLEG